MKNTDFRNSASDFQMENRSRGHGFRLTKA